MKYGYTTISDVATCNDCGVVFDCPSNAQANASRHAKKYKHKVTGEKQILYSYDGS
jgi:hypothetical protein